MDVTPKSSDGETRSGSSSELQRTDPMETSTGVASSVLGKRKDPGERVGDRESADDDEVKDEEEEEDSDPNWDKDSFDGREYHSSDDYSNYENDKEQEKRIRCYHRTVIKSKGFFENTDGFPAARWGGYDRVKDLDGDFKYGMTYGEFIIHMTNLCVEKYNKTKKKNVRFHQFLRANYHPGGTTKYYITFLARDSDSPDDPLIEYQAKVGRRGGKTYPILCRPSPL